MMLSFGMQDLGFSSNKYTWSNNRRGTAYVATRLDRAICNPHWFTSFNDPQLSHLPKHSSDHCPVLLSHSQRFFPANAPFKFEAMWIQHPDFLKLVADTWSSDIAGHSQFVLAQKLKSMKQVLKVWNKTVFGDIKLKVKLTESKAISIQEILDAGPSNTLHQDLSEAKSSLHNWLLIQETHWHQKARTRWLNEGGRKTTFFHASAKSRGAINRISKILSDGTWVEDPSQIQLLAFDYFSLMVSSPSPTPAKALFQVDSSKLSPAQYVQLSSYPDAEEIGLAFFFFFFLST